YLIFIQLMHYLSICSEHPMTSNALSDLSGNNILIRREKTGINRAVMIDGFGTTDLIPICHYFPHFARMKILRHWERFLPKIHMDHPQTSFEMNSSSMELNTLLP
ncbi:YrbL family protein, partial [uncultured Sutterella sp.]|uniref:YrbL family protein n=2 Tax=uncultured Sutterella sp. TaxID=286133 RepID=UPI00266F8842